MKKILILVLALIFVLSFASCGGNAAQDTESQDAAVSEEAAEEQEVEEESAPEEIVPSGEWNGTDEFSGEQVPGLQMYIYESSAEQVVFDYTSSAGTFNDITISLDAEQSGSVEVGNGVSLSMTFYDDEIHVDEIEGMGAMAYIFKK